MNIQIKSALLADAVVVIMTAMVGCTGAMKPHADPSQAVAASQAAISTLLPGLVKPRIIVVKRERQLSLYDGRRLVKVYRCCTGRSAGDKVREGDRRTPEGKFFVCYKNPKSKFTLSLGLNYPNPEDAARGLRDGLINQEQHDRLVQASDGRSFDAAMWESLWKTQLGGEIMIHGAGADRAGTAGCVGMDDDDIRELYPRIPLGTTVTIRP